MLAIRHPVGISYIDGVGPPEATYNSLKSIGSRVVSNTSALGVTDVLSFLIGENGGDVDSWIIRAYDIHDTIIDTQSLSGARRPGWARCSSAAAASSYFPVRIRPGAARVCTGCFSGILSECTIIR